MPLSLAIPNIIFATDHECAIEFPIFVDILVDGIGLSCCLIEHSQTVVFLK